MKQLMPTKLKRRLFTQSPHLFVWIMLILYFLNYRLLTSKCNELEPFAIARMNPKNVIAAIVLTINNNFDSAQVVALGCGTKSFCGYCMPTDGMHVLDMHGEILAQRAFKRFLINQLYLLIRSPGGL